MYCKPTADETNVARDAAATSVEEQQKQSTKSAESTCNAARQAYNQCTFQSGAQVARVQSHMGAKLTPHLCNTLIYISTPPTGSCMGVLTMQCRGK